MLSIFLTLFKKQYVYYFKTLNLASLALSIQTIYWLQAHRIPFQSLTQSRVPFWKYKSDCLVSVAIPQYN